MSIAIAKDESGIKFYGKQAEPLLVIYDNTKVALVKDNIITSSHDAFLYSQAVAIAGVFLTALGAPKNQYKKNFIKATYISEVDQQTDETMYSPRKVLRWLETNNIVTVNKSKRIKYQFTGFGYSYGKLVITYKPVVW